ncbi:hypothetical protein [Aliiruegeria lutimaris]|uniref:Phospholipase A2 n=1 Tax=Aliiruegeria lutimaris TaxID=571298 RepID=A0A1G8ZS09_9RHOB|nr:hypothetical protein [Aliiruegeria lutimaris]SDK17902.1 hypothetical protein SAMN04488026_103329 [Aliiruegeria lutimaris]
MARRNILALLLVFSGGGVAAQDWSEQLSRTLELPSHQWLETLRSTPEVTLNDFTTDGCSGGMSSLWAFFAERYPSFVEALGGHPPWEECCVTHDRAYHTGGPDPAAEASYEARLEADRVLRECVRETQSAQDSILRDEYGLSEPQVRAAYGAVAAGMYQAVRLGGGPCTGLPWRWGYGYPQCWQKPDE